MNALRACPLCGEAVTVGFGTWGINCEKCGYGCYVYYSSQAVAVETWNRRPLEDALATESARLLALIRDAMTILDAGHEPGEYAEGVWANEIRKTLTEAEHNGDHNTTEP